jgi:tetratricopeptide (TPR) repeat protein
MEKISEKFPEKAESYSWSAFFNAINGFNEADTKAKDVILAKAEKQIDKAIEIDANNDEFYVIKAMVFQGQLLVDPQMRGQEYSAKADKMIAKALELNPENARAYYLKAQNIYDRPEQYGGGAKNALPIIKTAKKLIDKQEITNKLAPSWGKEEIEELLNTCKK